MARRSKRLQTMTSQSIALTILQSDRNQGRVFRRISGKQEVDAIDARSLDVVIVNAATSIHREFYKDAYVEGVEAVPVCWSSDSIARR
jgi:hypothetical protein